MIPRRKPRRRRWGEFPYRQIGPSKSVSLPIPYRPAEGRQEAGEEESGKPLRSEPVIELPSGDWLDLGSGTHAPERSSTRRMKLAGPATGHGEIGRNEPTRRSVRWRAPCRIRDRIVGASTHCHARQVAEP